MKLFPNQKTFVPNLKAIRKQFESSLTEVFSQSNYKRISKIYNTLSQLKRKRDVSVEGLSREIEIEFLQY